MADDAESIDIDAHISQEDIEMFTGISSVHFPSIDPIGTMLVAFDDGSIKVWQSSVRNEQMMKILELQQMGKKKTNSKEAAPVMYNIAEVGYQQFDLRDSFDIFCNPHVNDEMDEYEAQHTKALYSVSNLIFDLTIALGQEIHQLHCSVRPRLDLPRSVLLLRRCPLVHLYPRHQAVDDQQDHQPVVLPHVHQDARDESGGSRT